MAVSLESFLDHAADQNVALNSSFEQLATAQYASYDDPDLLFAICAAGICLREQPESSLADKSITPPEKWANDTPATVLCGLINATVDPESPPAGVRNFALTPERVETCAYADVAFSRVLARLAFYDGREMRPCIIHTEDDEPLILQKSGHYGQLSGLTLRETWINSIEYPAGSIVRMEYDGMERELSVNSPLSRRLHLRSAEAITGMSFQRLSAYAVPPRERRVLFAANSFGVSFEHMPAVRDLLAATPISEVCAIAKEAMGAASKF